MPPTEYSPRCSRAGRRRWTAARVAAAALLTILFPACTGIQRQLVHEPLYPEPAPPVKIDWYHTLVRDLPRLRHDRGDRWPLVLWQGVGFDPLTPRQIKALLERGIVQHLRLRTPDIEAARALQAAGAPVMLMEGAGDAWPYDEVQGDKRWRLRFPAGATVPQWWRELADPTLDAGWQRSSVLTRSRLQRYKSDGVKVDAVWLDYEGAQLHDDYQALRASTSAARMPHGVLDSERRYRNYRRNRWLIRLSRYLAQPVLEVYPQASVTNWLVTASSTDHPVLSWTDWPHPRSPGLSFTDTNPIAYGIDQYFLSAWPPGLEVNRENVDRFYTHLLLRQVSADAFNRAEAGKGTGAVAWVSRWVADRPDRRAPVMSRAAYREALRHIWLRGVDAMEVFNPARKGYERCAVQEVEDVQRVYDEMLAYRQFLEHGEVMNFGVPDKADDGMIWSGLRLGDRALVRLTNLGARQKHAYICLTREWCVNLPMPRHGHTYVLKAGKK